MGCAGHTLLMAKAGWGERIKTRARELGLTDSAVAHSLGMAQRRYSAYANESREPDFSTLARICTVLRTTPDAVLAFSAHPEISPGDAVAARVLAVLNAMSPEDRTRAAAVVETLAAYPGDATEETAHRKSRTPNSS